MDGLMDGTDGGMDGMWERRDGVDGMAWMDLVGGWLVRCFVASLLLCLRACCPRVAHVSERGVIRNALGSLAQQPGDARDAGDA